MRPIARRRLSALALVLAVLLPTLVGGLAIRGLQPDPALAWATRLPNLRMLPLRDWKIETVNGRRLLRFTTTMGNAGPGAFEVRGYRASTENTMHIDQVLYDGGGNTRRVRTGASGQYAGDGHDHWHVQRIMTYELYKVDNPSTVRAGAKTGFCFLDTTAWRLDLPHARQSPYYQEAWCGVRRSTRMTVGISVGWGDRYPWNFAFQWIDITGLASGRYVVRATVDIADWYAETDDYDNCRWTRIRIPKSGSSVTVLGSGGGCGHAAITPAASFPGTKTYGSVRQISMEAGSYTGFTFNALSTQLRAKRRALDAPRTFTVAARGPIPNRAGRWFLVTSGPWTGYWVRDTSRVDLVPG